MKFINSIPILYYELSVSPERVRGAFPQALEFKNPTPESFSVLQTPAKNTGLLVIDLGDENRHIFVLPLRDELVLINDAFPRVFVVPSKGLGEFFSALVKGSLGELLDRGIRKKGKKWRFIIDGVAALVIVSVGDYFNLGFWGAVLLGLVFTTVEYLLGPKKGAVMPMMTELDRSMVKKIYEASEKKGKVLRVSI